MGLWERRKSQVVAQERRDFEEKMEAFQRDFKKGLGYSHKYTCTEMHPCIRDVTLRHVLH